jgi:hypothetical protein
MNEKREILGNLSLVEYARIMSSVYVWMTTRDQLAGINHQPVRFITNGQKPI